MEQGRAGRTWRIGAALLVIGLASSTSVGVASAHGNAKVKVNDAWARTSPMEATNGAVYMTLRNKGDDDNALVRASVPASVAMEVQLHETTMGPGGTMMMSEVPEIAIPASSTTALAPGGYHIMLMDLAAPLAVGGKVKVTLEFESGKRQTVKAVVKQ